LKALEYSGFSYAFLSSLWKTFSDRELERYIAENTAARWFANFRLDDKTPDHTLSCKARKKIGTKLLSDIFAELRNQLKAKGLIGE
jgi:IS5 family transposase